MTNYKFNQLPSQKNEKFATTENNFKKKKAAVINLGTCLSCYFSKKKIKKETRYHSPITVL